MPDATNIAEGIRHWADVSPDLVALEDDATTLTFAELLEQVDRMGDAARRTTSGWVDGRFLPVIVDRSAASCAAVIACLAYRVPFFPVEARTPTARMIALLDLAGAPDRYLAAPGVDVQDVPECRPVEFEEGTGFGPPDGADVDLLRPGLVVFTSGTTGSPKGVVLDWATVDLRWRRGEAEPHEEPPAYRTPLLVPLDSTFGLSILGHLGSGCTTLVIDASTYNPIDLLRRIAQFAPSSMALPPQLGRILAQLPDKEGLFLSSVRRLQSGSEGFRYESLAGLLSILPDSVEVLFGYGASEVYHVMSHRFTLGSVPAAGPVPIGLPEIDEDVRFVPVPDVADGVFEVHSKGAIASGYLGDEAQNRLRFLTDPDGTRWWASSDLVRLNDEGLYEHLGRGDDIVKVRGKIASPSEVEAVLMRTRGIRAAFVIPLEQDGVVRLIAHVEVQPGSDVTLAQVRESLSAQLPEHMVPSAVLRHATLPASDRGKVERLALMAGPFEPWA